MDQSYEDELVLFLGAENHRLIAEDFSLEMPLKTRLRLLDIAERMDPREDDHESRGR